MDATGHGTLEFGPHPGNPNIPSGAYQVEVSINAANVSIDAGDWITQPSGYVTVDMDGVLSGDKQAITGRVDNSSCGAFDLSRQDGGKDETTMIGEAPPVTPKQKDGGGSKPDAGLELVPEETIPSDPGTDDPQAVAPGTPPDAVLAPAPPLAEPADLVAIPGVAWPDNILRLIDVAGFQTVLDLDGEPCTDPRFSVEIDAPAILPLVQRNMAGMMSLAYNPFETTGSCGLGSWDLEVDPIPVFYLGQHRSREMRAVHVQRRDNCGPETRIERQRAGGGRDGLCRCL